jgi:hypothetical protein
MRTLAIGLITVAGIALAAPAVAEDFYVGGGGFGVEVDSGYRHHRDWDGNRRYREGYRSYGSDRWDRPRCRTTIIREDGMVRKIRRCRD